MQAEEIRTHLRKKPFQPFRVHLSEGTSFEVPHPELALLNQREIAIALGGRGDKIPERFVYCDILHITHLEPFPPTSPGRDAPN